MGLDEPTTPEGVPTLRWLMEKVQRGEITAQEFLKLSKERDTRQRERRLGGDPNFVPVVQERERKK